MTDEAAMVPATGCETTEGLVALLRERDRHGRAKYGTTLDRGDLSFDAWMQHLLEELLDAAGYVQAARRELVQQGPLVTVTRLNPHQIVNVVVDLLPTEKAVRDIDVRAFAQVTADGRVRGLSVYYPATIPPDAPAPGYGAPSRD